MAYIPTGITSIVNTIPSSVQVGASVMGHAPVVIVGGSVAVATGNSSVQVLNPVSTLAVNPTPASVQVLNPVSVLAVTQSGAPWANTNVGSVITVGQGSIAVNIIAGSVAVATGNSSVQVLNPVSLLSVTQGTDPWTVKSSLAGGIFPVSGSVAATITNTNVNIAGSVVAFLGNSTNASVITVGTAAANQSVSGTVDVAQIGAWRTSVINSTPSSLLAGVSVIGLPPVNVTNTNLNIGGSVVAFEGAGWSGSVAALITNTNVNVSGSVAAFKLGTWVTSLVSTVPSSVIVGTSIFGQLPAGTAPLGSVAVLQGTNPWNISGSVAAFQAGTVITSISGIPQVSVHGTVKIFPASVVTGHGSVNGAASVQILAAPGAGLYNYVTDFLLSNTGAATTLVTFTDGDGSIMGKSIAPTGGGAIATGLAIPMKTLQTNKVVNILAATATSVLHAWIGAYKAP